jgi:hypothetical protein
MRAETARERSRERRRTRDAKIDWKALSKRIGHSGVAFTMKQYAQTDLEADRQVANTLAELIINGSLAAVDIERPASHGPEASVSGRSIRKPSDEGTAA